MNAASLSLTAHYTVVYSALLETTEGSSQIPFVVWAGIPGRHRNQATLKELLDRVARAFQRLACLLPPAVAHMPWLAVWSDGLPCSKHALPVELVELPLIGVGPAGQFEIQAHMNSGADTISDADVVFQFDSEILYRLEATERQLHVNSGFETRFRTEPEYAGPRKVFDATLLAGNLVLVPGEKQAFRFSSHLLRVGKGNVAKVGD